jgi:hypothetical protein
MRVRFPFKHWHLGVLGIGILSSATSAATSSGQHVVRRAELWRWGSRPQVGGRLQAKLGPAGLGEGKGWGTEEGEGTTGEGDGATGQGEGSTLAGLRFF